MAKGNPKPSKPFVKGDPRINLKGGPKKDFSRAEICRAAAMHELEKPYAKGDNKTKLQALTESMVRRSIEEGDANAYNAILKMLGAFNHEVKMSGEGISIVYLDKQDELL